MSASKKSKLSGDFFSLALTCLSLFLMMPTGVAAQQQDYVDMSVMFYNTENLFDCNDDSLSTGDDEFLPSSARHWTCARFNHKLEKTAKVILAAGQWQPPVLVGLCEIENKNVVSRLVYSTSLAEMGYRFVHFESPDSRGIDVALLYRKNSFTPLQSSPIKVVLADNKATRDILYVKGVFNKTDTIHVFVNHWPSRLGGEAQSAINRMTAAKTLTSVCDSIALSCKNPKIIVMGDFNDGPNDESIQSLAACGLVNMATVQSNKPLGSNKFHQDWALIDQILVSSSFIDSWRKSGFVPTFKAIDLPFLLITDETYLGQKPFRTFSGPRYLGGFSDHLPVMLILERNKQVSVDTNRFKASPFVADTIQTQPR